MSLFTRILKSPFNLRYLSSLSFKAGDEFRITKIIRQKDVEDFAKITGDFNPIHLESTPKDQRIIHGAFLNGIISGVIGTRFPGPGTIVLSQEFQFPHKCVVDKEIEILVKVLESRKILKIGYECKQQDKLVFQGVAKIIRK